MSEKIALVTGGSRGLGRSTTLALAKRGVKVIFTFQSDDASAMKVVEEVKIAGSQAQYLQLDVSKPDTLDKFIHDFQKALQAWNVDRFDYLVHNAGIGSHGTVAGHNAEALDLMYNIHFKSVFLLTQKSMPFIQKGGRILLVSSGLARFTLPGFVVYSCMKGAVEVFTKYLAQELGPRGISVVCARTGAIETDFGGGVIRDDVEMNKRTASTIALGRVGQADDVGPAYASLLSEDLRWVNGTVVEISGGQRI